MKRTQCLVMILVLAFCLPLWATDNRLPNGSTTKYVQFFAVKAADHLSAFTGGTSFTVYYCLGNGTATVMTTPTVAEKDSTNMAGWYTLLVDESGMTTLTAGDDEAPLGLEITHTGMDPVHRQVEVYRPKITAGQTVTAASGNVNAMVQGFIGTAVTEAGGAGRLAAAVSTWGNVATPVATAASVNQTGDPYAYLVATIKTSLDTILGSVQGPPAWNGRR